MSLSGVNIRGLVVALTSIYALINYTRAPSTFSGFSIHLSDVALKSVFAVGSSLLPNVRMWSFQGESLANSLRFRRLCVSELLYSRILNFIQVMKMYVFCIFKYINVEFFVSFFRSIYYIIE